MIGKGATWLVVFSDPDPLDAGAGRKERFIDGCLKRFLKPGFRHCFALRRAEAFDGWVLVNWGLGRVVVREVPADEPVVIRGERFGSYLEYLRLLAENDLAHALEVEERHPDVDRWVPRGISSCVTMVKHLIGVTAPGIRTPWALYRHLTQEKPG